MPILIFSPGANFGHHPLFEDLKFKISFQERTDSKYEKNQNSKKKTTKEQ